MYKEEISAKRGDKCTHRVFGVGAGGRKEENEDGGVDEGPDLEFKDLSSCVHTS